MIRRQPINPPDIPHRPVPGESFEWRFEGRHGPRWLGPCHLIDSPDRLSDEMKVRFNNPDYIVMLNEEGLITHLRATTETRAYRGGKGIGLT